MGSFVELNGRLEIPTGVKIIKKADYARFVAAEQVLEAARKLAEQIAAEARAAYEQQKKEGREEGILQGKTEIAERMLEGVSRSVDYLEGMENAVVDIVMKSLASVLGEMNEKDLVCRVVRRALQRVRDQKKILLKVCVDDAEAVQARLDEMVRAYPGIGLVQVQPDPRLGPRECILETEMGVVDASLDKQLATIEKSFRQHLSGARA